MNRQEATTLTYSYVDSKRLEEAFFTPPIKKKPSKTHPSIKKIIIIVSTILSLVILLFVLNYEMIILPRLHKPSDENTTYLLAKDTLKSLTLLNADKRILKRGSYSFYLSMPRNEKVAIELEFKNNLDLRNKNLTFWIKKTNIPLDMEIIIKDAGFFSNALRPKKITAKKEYNSKYAKISTDFEYIKSNKINLSKIKQIKINFLYTPDESGPASSNDTIEYWGKNWVFIKDIVLSKKEAK